MLCPYGIRMRQNTRGRQRYERQQRNRGRPSASLRINQREVELRKSGVFRMDYSGDKISGAHMHRSGPIRRSG